jgi:hypothetical protein
MKRRQSPARTVQSHHRRQCADHRCTTCNPPPSDDPELGPPVYDPVFKCWTYPYYKKEEDKESSPEPKASPAPSPPKKEVHEIEVQVDYVPPEKPLAIPISTQTFPKEVHEIEIQTGPVMRTVEIQAAVPRPPRSLKYTPDQAARMVQRIYRRLILFQRMVIFR